MVVCQTGQIIIIHNANMMMAHVNKEGCMSEWADNYDEYATIDNGLCELNGCMSNWADNYDELATDDDGSCYREGCMSDWADNYDELATDDDGSCYKEGCMSDWADNYDENATIDNESCQLLGCTDSTMFNYDPLATQNDGFVIQFIQGCLDPDANNFTELTGNNFIDPNTPCEDCCLYIGCMDSLAFNYNPINNIDDNKCMFIMVVQILLLVTMMIHQTMMDLVSCQSYIIIVQDYVLMILM